jgi:hypothetical protein
MFYIRIITMKRFYASGFVAVAMLTTNADIAAAATVQQPQCSTLSVTTSTSCQTVYGNNDSANAMNVFGSGSGVFNTTGWLLVDKSGDNNVKVAPFNLVSSPDGAKSGIWSVASFGGYTKAALVLKGGSEAWVAYMIDISKLSGLWSTQDIRNGGGRQPNLSHMTLYVSDFVAPVPVPAAGLLLLGALGMFGAAGRRKRT